MIDIQNEFSNYLLTDSFFYQHDEQVSCQSQKNEELELISSEYNHQNMEQTNDDQKNEQQSNDSSNPNFITLEKNISIQCNALKNESNQSKDDKQGEIKGHQLKKKISKQILKQRGNSKIPGETKNTPKCFARQLQLFIKYICQKTEDPELKSLIIDQDIKQFLSINVDKLTKSDLVQFIETQNGRIFCKEFFGQCFWTFGIVKESKTDVSVLYRHNIESFYQVFKKKTQKNKGN